MKMPPYQVFFVSILVTACSHLPPAQDPLIAKAASLGPYPVKRSEVVERLGLDAIVSEKTSGGIRGMRIWHYETWRLSSGLEIVAYDSDRAADSEAANFLQRSSGITLQGIPSDPSLEPPAISTRVEFERIVIRNEQSRILFDSGGEKQQDR